MHDQPSSAEKGLQKEREILGTVNPEAKQEVLAVIEKVRGSEGVEDPLLDEVRAVYSKMGHRERAAVVSELYRHIQTHPNRKKERTVLIDWVMRHQVVDAEEEISPTDPESPWMNDVHAAIAEALGAELDELEYYTAVDSPLDWHEGIDGFFIWRAPDGAKIMTFDFTISVHKQNEQVDMVIYWSPLPVPVEERDDFLYLAGSEAHGPHIQREMERFTERLRENGTDMAALFQPITLPNIDKN